MKGEYITDNHLKMIYKEMLEDMFKVKINEEKRIIYVRDEKTRNNFERYLERTLIPGNLMSDKNVMTEIFKVESKQVT